ncbi:hypothetical protein J1G37_01305 [Pseudomonas sp. Marseille-Q1929]|nr:hypothetical protein [Pseudomonas sp. Marseille-Q1929]
MKRNRVSLSHVSVCVDHDRWALFIKLSWNCGSALEQTSSDSRSTGVLRFGVFHARVAFTGRSIVRPAVFCGFSM